MKISKYTQIIKKKGYATWINNTNYDEVYLAHSMGVYIADGLPEVRGESTAFRILDVDEKQKKKIVLKIRQTSSRADVEGFDLSNESLPGDMKADPMRMSLCMDGKIYHALSLPDNTIMFYNSDYLNPLIDRIKSEIGYISYVCRRKTYTGERYIIIKDGIETIGAIMPEQIVTEGYMEELEKFRLRCKKMYLGENYDNGPEEGEEIDS